MRGGALFNGKEGRGDFRRILIDFIKVANNKKIVNDLPHSNPFVSIRSTPYCIAQKNVVSLHGDIIFLILRQEYAI